MLEDELDDDVFVVQAGNGVVAKYIINNNIFADGVLVLYGIVSSFLFPFFFVRSSTFFIFAINI